MPAPVCNPYDILPLNAAFWLVLATCSASCLKNNTEKDLLPVAIAFPIFVTTILGVMLSDGVSCIFQELFGTTKTEVIKILGWGISGIIAFYGLCILSRRVAAQEKGLVQDRFKAAVEHLSNKDSETARIASFYELFYLAKGNKDDYAQTVLDVLCTHLRQITDYEDITNYYEAYDHPEEVKILARILFGIETGRYFKGLRFDLRRTNLTGIDFRGMQNPKEVDFSLAELSHAIFNDTNLSGASFYNATLYESKFVKTNLQGADLRKAKFNIADLKEADFSNAKMEDAVLQYAKCSKTNFHKASLLDADFCHVDLREAENLQTALLWGAKHNKGENSKGTQFPKGFALEPRGMKYCPTDDKK